MKNHVFYNILYLDYVEDGKNFQNRPQMMSLKNTHHINNYSPIYEESSTEPIHTQVHKVG